MTVTEAKTLGINIIYDTTTEVNNKVYITGTSYATIEYLLERHNPKELYILPQTDSHLDWRFPDEKTTLRYFQIPEKEQINNYGR
jgi:hypothetical protein